MVSAPKSFGSALQLNKIPVLGLVPESSATGSAPASPVPGQLWLDSTLGRLKVWEGAAWVLASQTGTEQTANKNASGGYAGLTAGLLAIAQIPTGQTGTTVPFGNDARFSDTRTPTDNSVTSAKIVDGAITDVDVNAANKDGVAGTASLRTIGTGAQQALSGATRLDTLTAPTAAVSMNSQVLTNLATPVSGTDAVNKNYADTLRQGLRLKDSVLVASTASLTLSGTQTIDGVAVVAGNRVLAKDQSTASANGIYDVAAGAWTRSSDADTYAELQDGAITFVAQGTVNANQSWAQTSTLTALTDPQTWTIQGAATAYLAGTGLSLAGTTFNVGGTANRITAAGTTVDISTAYVGQTSITTLGTITAGTWTGTAIAVANGGTGATTAAAARTNLVTVGRYAADMAALVAGTELIITHSLGSQDVQVGFQDTTTKADVELSWRAASTTTIGVTADIAYGAAALRVIVLG